MATKTSFLASFKDYIKMVVIIPLIGSALIAYGFCRQCIQQGNYEDYFVNLTFSFVLWNAIALGSYHLVVKPLDKFLPWLEHSFWRAIVGVVLSLTYVIAVILVVYYILLDWYYGYDFVDYLSKGKITQPIVYSVLMAVFISLFFHARGFFMAWREAAVQNEKLKTENINSRFESLKTQLNPHFLFNSLNALTTLVEDKDEGAVDFIHQLSGVYRYVLQQGESELVPLVGEVDFVKSYIELHKIRFGDNFKVTIEGQELLRDYHMIPPLALQLLIENAIKHNEISSEKNLNIQINIENDRFSVTNNINPIRIAKKDSTQLGLKNLKQRYSYLTDNEISVTQETNLFKVTLPILNTYS